MSIVLQDLTSPHIETAEGAFKKWVWMPDGARARTAVTDCKFCTSGRPGGSANGRPVRPTSNPLDFAFRIVLQSDAAALSQKNLPGMKRAIIKAVRKLQTETIQKASDQAPLRIQMLVDADGRAFEHKMQKGLTKK